MKKLATLVLCALMLFSAVMPVTTLAKTKKCTHKNTTWVTTSKATCTTPKIVVKFCTKCKKQLAFEKVGKPLGHYWHSWKKNPITGKVSRGCYHCKVRQYK